MEEDVGSHPNHQVSFLPVNQPNSPPESKHRRASLSCERCRKRKTRCEPFHGQQKPCKRCVQESRPCDWRSSKGVKRKAATGLEQPARRKGLNQPSLELEADLHPQSSPASIPRRQERSPDVNNEYSTGADVLRSLASARLRNTADALDLLTVTATDRRNTDERLSPLVNFQSPGAARIDPARQARLSPGVTEQQRRGWDNFILIKKQVVTRVEVIEYFSFFFAKLWPLRPVIPPCYRDPAKYTTLVVEEPVLSTCLVTISSRYLPLSGSHGEIRSERIHWRAWKVLQRLLQSVVWGTTFTRSLGAIAAMLLLIEWHSKAINSPMDLTDDDVGEFGDGLSSPTFAPSNDTTTPVGQPRYGVTTLMERLNIVAPAYRSNKMSWILLSNAIALAHEGCCFEVKPHGSVPMDSEHGAIKQEWSKLICVFIYFADEQLSTRLGIEPLLPDGSRAMVKDRLASNFANSLPDRSLWESYFELSIHRAQARDCLHSLRRTGTNVADLDILPDMERISHGLGRWRVQQNYYQHDPENFLRACLEIEYHYTMMYSFAPASHSLGTSLSGHRATAERSTEPVDLSHFARQAADSSYKLLSIVVDVLYPSGLLPYLPVRCWLFIVAASLHLLKSTLKGGQPISDSHPNAHLLRSTVHALRDGSPDDTHMAMRYFKFLEAILQASITPSSHMTHRTPNADQTMDRGTGAVPAMEPGIENAFTTPGFGLDGAWDFQAAFDPIFNELISMESVLGGSSL